MSMQNAAISDTNTPAITAHSFSLKNHFCVEWCIE